MVKILVVRRFGGCVASGGGDLSVEEKALGEKNFSLTLSRKWYFEAKTVVTREPSLRFTLNQSRIS